MIKAKYFLIVIFLMHVHIIAAQRDSLFHLPEVEILAIKSDLADELNTISINTTDLQTYGNNSQQLLASRLGIYLKAYGYGQISTMSYRGGNSGQLLTLWNGMPINNSMLGSYDLSLAPISLIQEVSLSRTNQSHLWGSGAITGALRLDNQFDSRLENHVNSTTEVGSFGQFSQRISSSVHKGKYRSTTTLFFGQSENDFKYSSENQIRDRNEHAYTNSQQLISSHEIRYKNQGTIEAHVWLQDVYKENPPTLTQTNSYSSLQDQNQRYLIKWGNTLNRWSFNVQSGYSRISNLFDDPLNQQSNDNRFTQWHNQVITQWRIAEGQNLSIGMDYERQSAHSENYASSEDLNTFNTYLNYQIRKDKHYGQIALQKQWNQRINNANPQLDLTYGYQLSNSLSLQIDGTLNAYRIPSLNDLFWNPGGNPDLLPEVADEVSLTVDFRFKGWNLNTNIYHRLTKNWILWSPSAEVFWTAQNLARINSRGLDLSLTGDIYEHEQFTISFDGSYAYTLSTSQSEIELPRILVGQQLVYVPEHQTNLRMNIFYAKLELGIEETLRGKVYGITNDLESYALTNVFVSFSEYSNKYNLNYKIGASINNLFESTYLLYENRPQPGRHFSLNIFLEI